MLETYYKDGSALFSVTIAKEKRITAVDAIRQIIGDDNAMTGSAVSTAVATTSTVNEISTIAMIGVAFVLLVLLLTTTSILSSGLTTVIGFLALCLMQFRIGPDLGLALAKGVALSLITVFTFMPALILKTYKIIDKTEHRSFMPSFQGFGRFVSRVMLPMVLVFAILIVPCYLASNANSFYYGASHIFGSATQMELSQALRDIPQVRSILSYVDTVGAAIPEQYLDSGTLSKLNSDSYTRMVLTMDAAYEGDAAFSLVEAVRDAAERYYPGAWYLAGEGVSAYDLMDTVTADMDKVDELISAIGDLDDGAWELHDGTEELYDATKTLNGKVGDLHSGVGDLTAGAGDLYTGLTGIAAQNQQLTSGAYTAYEGLCTAAAAALNSQLEANGMDAVTLTPSTYSAVLMSLLEKLDADIVYQERYDTALEQVTLQVNERADELYRGYVDSQANSVYLAYVTAQAAVYLQTAEGQALVAQAADNMTEEQKAQILNAAVATVSAAAAGAGSLKLNMDTLYSSTGKLKLSVGELRDAVGELYDGTGELTNGTSEFVDQTSDMDPQISDEIDSMTNSFSGGDTISFVSEKNAHMNAVQFVIKTAAIEKAEVPLDDAGESAPLTFWQKLLRLVGLYA